MSDPDDLPLSPIAIALLAAILLLLTFGLGYVAGGVDTPRPTDGTTTTYEYDAGTTTVQVDRWWALGPLGDEYDVSITYRMTEDGPERIVHVRPTEGDP